jgi:hypothetical protein
MGVYVLRDGSIGLSEVSLSLPLSLSHTQTTDTDALKAIQEVNI